MGHWHFHELMQFAVLKKWTLGLDSMAETLKLQILKEHMAVTPAFVNQIVYLKWMTSGCRNCTSRSDWSSARHAERPKITVSATAWLTTSRIHKVMGRSTVYNWKTSVHFQMFCSFSASWTENFQMLRSTETLPCVTTFSRQNGNWGILISCKTTRCFNWIQDSDVEHDPSFIHPSDRQVALL